MKNKTKQNKTKQNKTKQVKRSRRNLKKTNKGGTSFIDGIKGFFKKHSSDSSDEQKKTFLASLDEYKKGIDELVLTDLIDDEMSTKIKNGLKESISKFYEDIKNKQMSELNSAEVRAIAGVVLTKTVILKLFANCPNCLNLDIKTEIKLEIVSRIEPLIKKPYTDFTEFEKAIKAKEQK
jgi:hypothetical protein